MSQTTVCLRVFIILFSLEMSESRPRVLLVAAKCFLASDLQTCLQSAGPRISFPEACVRWGGQRLWSLMAALEGRRVNLLIEPPVSFLTSALFYLPCLHSRPHSSSSSPSPFPIFPPPSFPFNWAVPVRGVGGIRPRPPRQLQTIREISGSSITIRRPACL